MTQVESQAVHENDTEMN